MKILKSLFSIKINKQKKRDINISREESIDDSFVFMDQVQRIHANVNEMIRFGEAKNGALLTVNFLILYSAFSGASIQRTQLLTVISYASIGCLISSILVLFISFIPTLKVQKDYNPVFFGTIASIGKDNYVNKMKCIQINTLGASYCEQIHINSQIARNKFVHFKIAVILAIISFIGSSTLLFIK